MEQKKNTTTIKSKAKAYGLKNTIIANDNYVLVAFSNKNTNYSGDIVRIQNANNNECLFEKDNPIETSINEKNIEIKNKKSVTTIDKPSIENVGMDELGLKESIEKYVFSQDSFNDNIHIQIGYNILDIKKTMAPFVNDVVFGLHNSIDSKEDIIGMIYTEKDRKTQYIDNQYSSKEKSKKADDLIYELSKRTNFYQNIFKKLTKEEKSNLKVNKYDSNRLDEEYNMNYNYDILRILSVLRQEIFHNTDSSKQELYGDKFYNIEKSMSTELIEILNTIYEDDLKNVTDSFFKNQVLNLQILKEIYKNEIDEESLIKELFDFIVRKEFKNLGVNITKIRENIIDNELPKDREKRFDSIRSKMYQLFDFIIFKEVKSQDEILESKIASLRLALTNEDKDKIYYEYAKYIFDEIGKDKLINTSNIILNFVRDNKKQKEIERVDINKLNKEPHIFVKLINFLCKFLDKKEINELTTSLINKMNNISDLIYTAKNINIKEKLEFKFNENFKMFENCKNIANDLKIIQSISRMKKKDSVIPYAKGLEILGLSLDDYTDKEFKNTNKNDRKTTSIKNFVINNVLNSKNFQYVIKYIDPSNCPDIVKNKELVKYILKSFPKQQILRYAETLNIQKESIDGIYELIAQKIYVNYGQRMLRDNIKGINYKPEYKQECQTIVGLYLSVVYVLIKNMVKINSVYTMAYHILERDSSFKGIKKNRYFTLDLYEKYKEKISLKNQKNISKNVEEYESNEDMFNNIFKLVRNKLDHLNHIFNMTNYLDKDVKFKGYYAFYHYLLQREVFENLKNKDFSNRIDELKEEVIKHKTYSKDLCKLFFLPFIYNQSRCKNLVTEALFNRYYGWNPENDYKINSIDKVD